MKRHVALASAALALGISAAEAPAKAETPEQAPAPAPAFVNDICLPSSLYLLSDVQNDLFVQPFIKRWRPYDDYVRFSMNKKYGKFMRHLSTVVTLDKPVDGATLHVELVNGDEFKTIKSKSVKLRVGKKGAGDKDVYAQIVGDSFTHGSFFRDALLDAGYVPKLHLVGLLKCGAGQYNEGRGGWALSTYFSVPSRPDRSYHGFMQPEGGRFWGNRDFWKMAWRCVRKTQPKGFEPTYSCARYDDYVDRFDEKTGVLLNPKAGDIQFDQSAKTFVRYDGAQWQPVDSKSLKWSFDYGKYLEMWGVKPPQFLFVLLGLNDWRGSMNADFTQWGERITVMKESYLKAVPDGKFVICIPCSTCGNIDNAAGDFTPRQNAAMWRFRDWLIKNFDAREKDGFYLLDAGINTDNENGYRLVTGAAAVPFEKYSGEGKLRVQAGNPHPYPNYPAMSIPFAAFIQYHR